MGVSGGGTGVAICEGTRNDGQSSSEGPRNEKKNTGSLGGAKLDGAGSVPGGRASWGSPRHVGRVGFSVGTVSGRNP